MVLGNSLGMIAPTTLTFGWELYIILLTYSKN